MDLQWFYSNRFGPYYCIFFIFKFLGGGGGYSIDLFLRIIFTAKTRNFLGCLRLWSRGHQVILDTSVS